VGSQSRDFEEHLGIAEGIEVSFAFILGIAFFVVLGMADPLAWVVTFHLLAFHLFLLLEHRVFLSCIRRLFVHRIVVGIEGSHLEHQHLGIIRLGMAILVQLEDRHPCYQHP
jgi:hypothetical protein